MDNNHGKKDWEAIISSRYKSLIAALIVLFLVVRYWDAIAGVILLLFKAMIPLAVGGVIAYAVNILLVFFEKWYDRIFKTKLMQKMKRGVCIVVSFLSLVIILTLIIRLVVPQLATAVTMMVTDSGGALQQLVDLMHKVPALSGYADTIQKNVLDPGDMQKIMTNALNLLQHGASAWMGEAMTMLQQVASKFTTIFIGLFFSFYVLAGKERLAEQSSRVIRTYLPKSEGKIHYVLSVLNDCFHNFIVGQVKDACVLGVMMTVAMLILRIPYAPMIGVIVAVTALVPIVGAFIGAVVGVLLILSVSPIKALIFIIMFVVVQQIDGNVTYPRIVGDSIGLPGIWVLAAVTIGGSVSGITGMLIFIPLFAAIYKILQADIRKRTVLAAETPADGDYGEDDIDV